MRLNKSQEVFIALVKAGLWGKATQLSSYGDCSFSDIYKMAEGQSVLGLVTAGLENVMDVKISKEWSVQFIGATLQIEQRNRAMNEFVARLITLLRKKNVYAILVKGQGIAQCYERPLWRACGDVDLLLSDDNYKKARETLIPLASTVDVEDVKRKHLALTIDSWIVELHGSLHSGITRNVDKGIDKIQDDIILGGGVRLWINDDVSIFLPSVNNDVIVVFTHILQHFYDGGIGLRQVCDWCRLLWAYRGQIDENRLKRQLESMTLLTEWKSFAALAVKYLGMQEDSIPLFDKTAKYGQKADRILSLILETGNFGRGRDETYKQRNTFIIRLAISFCRHTRDFFRQIRIFPKKALWVWMKMIVKGCRFAIKGCNGKD